MTIKITAAARKIGARGTEAWRRLKKRAVEVDRADYLELAIAFQSGREWAMHESDSNAPRGSGYNAAFSDWLSEFSLTDFNATSRGLLLVYMDRRGEVDDYIEAHPEIAHLSLPNIVKEWKKASRPPPEPKDLSTDKSAESAAAPDLTVDQHLDALLGLLKAMPWTEVRPMLSAFSARLWEEHPGACPDDAEPAGPPEPKKPRRRTGKFQWKDVTTNGEPQRWMSRLSDTSAYEIISQRDDDKTYAYDVVFRVGANREPLGLATTLARAKAAAEQHHAEGAE